MAIRQIFACSIALAAGAMIIAPPGSSLAAGPQNYPMPSYQSASLPPATGVQQFSSQVPPTSIVRPDYIIGPDDVIAVDVFQIPDLSRTFKSMRKA